MKHIIIGTDHAGFTLKESLKAYLEGEGWEVTDVGTYTADAVDYPDFGSKVASRVGSGEFSKGILICGSGVGMSIVANKFTGVRAALCLDTEMASLSARHNNANVLVLPGRRLDLLKSVAIINAWITTTFEGGRHQQRIDKIHEWERTRCLGII